MAKANGRGALQAARLLGEVLSDAREGASTPHAQGGPAAHQGTHVQPTPPGGRHQLLPESSLCTKPPSLVALYQYGK